MDGIALTGYKSRSEALEALKKYTQASQEKLPDAMVSEAERVLLDCIIFVQRARDAKIGRGEKIRLDDEEVSKDLTNIAWALGLYPMPQWFMDFYKMRKRMGILSAVPFIEREFGKRGMEEKKKYVLRDPNEKEEEWITE
jgi:hypothetical protein